jgi:SAM-dependent methyltransferase
MSHSSAPMQGVTSPAQGLDILADDRTHYVCTDIAVERSFEADFFDRVVSFSVFEHVVHPHAVLAELYRVMKPGGIAFIMANLHRGASVAPLPRDHIPIPAPPVQRRRHPPVP